MMYWRRAAPPPPRSGLIRKLGGDVVGVQVLIELEDLGGRKRLPDVKVVSEIVY